MPFHAQIRQTEYAAHVLTIASVQEMLQFSIVLINAQKTCMRPFHAQTQQTESVNIVQMRATATAAP